MANAPILGTAFLYLVVLLDIRIDDINRKLVHVFHIMFVLLSVMKNGGKHKLVYLVS